MLILYTIMKLSGSYQIKLEKQKAEERRLPGEDTDDEDEDSIDPAKFTIEPDDTNPKLNALIVR